MKKINRYLTKHQTFRLTEHEKDKLHEFAKRHNTNPTDLLRAFVSNLDDKDTVESLKQGYRSDKMLRKELNFLQRTNLNRTATEKALLYYLSMISNNINQIAKWANTYKNRAEVSIVTDSLKKVIAYAESARKLCNQAKLKNKKSIQEAKEDVYNQVFKSQGQQSTD